MLMKNLTKSLIFELPESGESAQYFPALDVPNVDLKAYYGENALRTELPLPKLAEIQVMRHYTALSNKNFGVEDGPYPLGSCTMKYNPAVNEAIAAMPGFAQVHPAQPDETVQGNLKMLRAFEQVLCDITGMKKYTFQPSAGAHGELTGVMMMRAYHEKRGDHARKVMLIPDSAHGTNPASAAMAGFTVREVKSLPNGQVDIEDLKSKLGPDVAGMMLTNPNTLGIFETGIEKITSLVREAGGLLYYDGANFNAIMMQVRPGDMGFDVVHWNVHKTLSTPHGGGGPGAGPVGVGEKLLPFLPKPVIGERPDGTLFWDFDRPDSIGRVRNYNGSFAINLRAFAYVLSNGADGLADVSESAVANANYLYQKVKDYYSAPLEGPFMHEFVISSDKLVEECGCRTMDVAKRLIDYGYHPPTVYFPLTIHEALMVEPTETETYEGLTAYAEAMVKIAKEAHENPELLHDAPHGTPVSRPDEVRAAKELDLKF